MSDSYNAHIIMVDQYYDGLPPETFTVKGYASLQKAFGWLEDVASEFDVETSDEGYEVIVPASQEETERHGLTSTVYRIEKTEIEV